MLNPTPLHQPLGVSGSLWPIHLKPINGEIFSSWLSRIAHAQGLTLNQFLRIYLPRPVGVGFDIDAISESTFFEAIVRGTGLPHEETVQTTFLPEQGKLYSGDDLLHAKWIIPLRLKSPKQTGIPFCPGCLISDSDLYYRKHWRYGFFTICPEHGLLETHCSRCGHPFSYQGADRTKRVAISTGLSNSCHRCKHRFSSSISPTTDNVTSRLIQFQSEIFDALETGWIQVPNRGLVHIFNYLHGLHQIASIFHNQVGEQAAGWVGQQAGISLIRDNVKASSSLEKQSPQTRAFALFFANWLIQEWPTRLTAMMESLNLTPRAVLPAPVDRPYWLTDTSIDGLSKIPRPRFENEIAAARAFLRTRIGWSISLAETVDFMQTGKFPQIKIRRPTSSAAAKLAFKASEEAAYEEKLHAIPNSHRQLYPPFKIDTVRKIFDEDREAGCQYVHELLRWLNQAADE